MNTDDSCLKSVQRQVERSTTREDRLPRKNFGGLDHARRGKGCATMRRTGAV